MNYHQPVLLLEAISSLDVKAGNKYIDATLGHGGHTLKLLRQNVFVYGFDQDPLNLKIATNRIKEAGLSKNFLGVNKNFIKVKSFFKKILINQ